MFGSDGSPIVQYVVIFAVIFAALAAIVLLVRRLTGRGLALPGRTNGRSRQPRLGIVDVYELDRARQLILLRRDNVEHLLLVGGPNDVVVERNIQRGQRPLPEAALRPDTASAGPAEPLPDPLSGAGRLPEPPLSLSLPERARRAGPAFEPGFEMPVVVSAPVPGSAAAPPVTLPLDAAQLDRDATARDATSRDPASGAGGLRDIPVPRRAGVAASPASPSPAFPPLGVGAAREPFSAGRIQRRATPTFTPTSADAAPVPASAQGPDLATAGAVPPGDDAPAEVVPPPPGRRAVDAGILSDMARQLQAALARPASAVTPPPSAAPPPAAGASPAPAVAPGGLAELPAPVDPVAAAMAAAPAARVPAPPVAAPVPAAPLGAPLPPARIPAAPSAAQPTSGQPIPVLPAPPPSPSPPPPGPAEPPSGTPFSVEEIEAEFARLLGRPLDRRE